MIFYLVFITAFVLYKVEVFSSNLNENYLSKENTDCIKGIFMFLIIASHAMSYIEFSGEHDKLYLLLQSYLGQGIVAMFLFYSGYGVSEAIKKKGLSYIKTIPIKRVLVTWINYDLAVILYWGVNICLGISYPKRKIVLAFLGWKSIGNSNWYIFTIIWCYLLTWIAFRLFYKNHRNAIIVTSVLIIIYSVVLHQQKSSEWYWYCTNSCYLIGLWYSYYKEKVNEFLFKSSTAYAACFWTILVLALVLRQGSRINLIIYEIWSAVFALMCLFISMKIQFNNPILRWMGVHTFELYIIQRLPMLVLKRLGVTDNPYVFLMISILLIFPCAFIFGKIKISGQAVR